MRQSRYRNARLKLLTYYSTKPYPICVICGCIDIRSLTLDHTFGGGCEQRRQVIGGMQLKSNRKHEAYTLWLLKERPTGIRVLCGRCNNRARILQKWGDPHVSGVRGAGRGRMPNKDFAMRMEG